MTITTVHVPMSLCYLCECGLIGNDANQCACGNRYGLLSLAAVMDRKPAETVLECSGSVSNYLGMPN
jgi:hypothetical protein